MMPATLSIVAAVFPPGRRGAAMGVWGGVSGLATAIGPSLGGLIVDSASWRWIFLINIPIGIVVLVLGWFMLPRTEGLKEGSRLDVAGSALLGAFLICLLVPLTFSPEWGWASTSTIGLLVVSAAAFVAFVIVERRVESPILDLDLVLKNRLFAAANTAALLNYMALYGVSLLTAIYLELVQDRSASLTGWLLLSMPLLMAVLSPFSGRLSDRIGSRVLASGGMVAIAAGMALLALNPESAPLWRVAACLAVVGLGMAAFSAPNTSAIMGSVRRDQLSQAGAFLGTMRTSGQALSVALLGGIAASQLGAVGGRLLLTHGRAGGALATHAVNAYAVGYRYAMVTGAALALVGALVSLTRGAHSAGPVAPPTGGAARPPAAPACE
jgi:EmrB/QacA subfamily drug resistance transporter